MPEPRYLKHLLICVNERPDSDPRGCCSARGGDALRLRLTQLIKQYGLKGQVRASKTGCLDACELGPVIAIYPDDIWYTGVQPEDVEAIFKASVLNNDVYQPRLASPETWQKLQTLRAKTPKP